jgi:hypothetical protein
MLAFPRLFLLLAMFVVSACFLWRSAGAAQKNARSKDTVPVRSG